MIRRVAVVGAGVMGHGIAQVYAQAGLAVRLCDVSEERLEAALRAVAGNLSLMVDEGLVPRAEADAAAARIEARVDLEAAVAGADLVTESIPEVLEQKLDLFDRIERAAGPGTIVASNTSTFPLARLAQRARSPGRMVVTHFFNPPHLVPLVEVLIHPSAPPEVASSTLDLLRRAGKTPVLLRKEVPGFVANRLQAALAREAFHLVQEGVADPRDVDAVVTEGPGFRWAFIGPVETADYGGLDTWQRVIDNLAPELSRAGSAPPAIVERVRRGELGTKTGKGIYSYDGVSVAERLRQRDRSFIELLKLKRRRG